jgi:cell division protein FtsW
MRRFGRLKQNLNHFLENQKKSPADWWLIGAIWFLVLFGLVVMSSAGVALGWQKYQDIYWHLKHQLLYGVLPGLILFIFFYCFDYKRLERYAPMMLFVSIGLLVLVFIPGIGAQWGTSRSWINLFGLSFQPAEAVKLTFLIYLSAWLANKEDHHLKDANYSLIPFLTVLGAVAGLMALEPDTGTMMILVGASLMVYFAAGASLTHILSIGGLSFVGLWVLLKLAPYRAARLTTFLHPELDPKGIGYHINQALLAVGSGGIFGRGYGHSRQKFAYLPEATGDSIFAIICEEMGFFVASFIIAVYIFIFFRGLKLAKQVSDPFGRLLTIGIVSWFVVQAFVNIGGIIGALPMTGVPLPFISYGGTALMITLAATGILANISKQAN